MKQPMTPAGRCPNTPAQVKAAHELIKEYERIQGSLAEMRRRTCYRHDLIRLVVSDNSSTETGFYFPGALYNLFYQAAEDAAVEIKHRLFLDFGVTMENK